MFLVHCFGYMFWVHVLGTKLVSPHTKTLPVIVVLTAVIYYASTILKTTFTLAKPNGKEVAQRVQKIN